MTDSERLHFYKELYDQEFALRESIRSSFTLPVGMLTVLIGLWYRLTSLYWEIPTGWMDWWFDYFGMLAGAFFIFSITYLIRAYVGHSYDSAQRPEQLLAFEQELAKWNESMDEYERTHGPTGHVRRSFETRLIEEFAVAAGNNSLVNRKRSSLVYNGSLTMVFGGLAVLSSYLIVMAVGLR